MQLFAYRNTERSILARRSDTRAADRAAVALHRAEVKTEREDRKRASSIVSEAIREADSIIKNAQNRAEAMLADAAAKAGKILVWAAMEDSEDKAVPGDLIRAVAMKHALTVADIKGPSRAMNIVDARQEAMAMVYKTRPDLSLPQIGRIFDRDHTTILHALRKLRVYRGDK